MHTRGSAIISIKGKRKMTTIPLQRTTRMAGQYSLSKIMGIWAAASLPMAILSWVIYPLVSPDFATDPLRSGVTKMLLLNLGLLWLSVLSLIIVRREEGDLRWATIKRRLRLETPRDPGSGKPRPRLWLWVIPAPDWDRPFRCCTGIHHG